MLDAPTPATELEQAKRNLEDSQRNAESLKAKIADLTKAVTAIDQKNKELVKAIDGVDQKRQELKDFVDRETKMLKAALPPDKIKAIEGLKKAATDDLDQLKTKVTAASTKVGDATKAIAPLKAATAVKQAKFDEVAGIPALVANLLKDLTALRTAAEKEGAANNFSRMYFLVLVMGDQLSKLDANIKTPDDYAKELNDAAEAVTVAGDAERDAKKALDVANAEEQQAQKNFQAKRDTWRQEVLDKIKPGSGGGDVSTAQQPATPAMTTSGSQP